MDYKYLLMADSTAKDTDGEVYKDVCSLDFQKMQSAASVVIVRVDSDWRERFDKTLLAYYKGQNIRKFYQLMQWLTNCPTVWDDDNTLENSNYEILYAFPKMASVEEDLVNRDVIS